METLKPSIDFSLQSNKVDFVESPDLTPEQSLESVKNLIGMTIIHESTEYKLVMCNVGEPHLINLLFEYRKGKFAPISVEANQVYTAESLAKVIGVELGNE
jgi:hypothetical protein